MRDFYINMNIYPEPLEAIELPTDQLIELERQLWWNKDNDEKVIKLLIFVSQELKHRGIK
ncbi:MAG: hypothetical protein RL316_946 [Bacteroidota bacterium]